MKSRASDVWREWSEDAGVPMDTTRTPDEYLQEVYIGVTETFWKALSKATQYPILFCEVLKNGENCYGVQVCYKCRGNFQVLYDGFPATQEQCFDAQYLSTMALRTALDMGEGGETYAQ